MYYWKFQYFTESMKTMCQISWSSLYLYPLCIFVVVIFLTTKYFQRRNRFRALDRIPGPPSNFLFGNALDTNVSPRELFKVLTGKFCTYGHKISKVWLFTKPYIIVYDADCFQAILSNSTHITKSNEYTFLMPWLGTGLATSSGEKWHSRRKMLTPAFHFKILEEFLDVFNQKTKKFASIFEKHADGDYFDIFRHAVNLTLDIILQTAIGVSSDAQDNPKSDYVNAVHTMSYLVQSQTMLPLLSNPLIFRLFGYKRMQDEALRTLHTFSGSAIKRRKEERLNKLTNSPELPEKKKHLAFLDTLLERAETDPTFTEEDIREEVDTFVAAGYETTASAISFTIFILGCNPEQQAKVHEELYSIFGDSDRDATMEDLRKMKYLECCMKEASRIFPPVPLMGRKTEEAIDLDGHTIPAGTSVYLITYRVHRDPKHFPDPEEFIPERFLPDSSVGRHPYCYIPFSAGPRNCIGQKFAFMEQKVAVSGIFRKFRVESAIRASDMEVLGQLVMRPLNTIDVRIFSRQK